MFYAFYRNRNDWMANRHLVTLTLATLADAKRAAHAIGAGMIQAANGGAWSNVTGAWVKA